MGLGVFWVIRGLAGFGLVLGVFAVFGSFATVLREFLGYFRGILGFPGFYVALLGFWVEFWVFLEVFGFG